jgi:hypothetical protein
MLMLFIQDFFKFTKVFQANRLKELIYLITFKALFNQIIELKIDLIMNL